MNPFQSISRYLNGHNSSSKDIWFIVLAVAAIAILWTGLALWDRFQSSRKREKQRLQTLFAELCDAHHIPSADVTILKQAAEIYGLSDPASLFFTPQVLSSYSEIGESAEQIMSLHQRLFGADYNAST
ncbi:MAG: hypothetical protein ACKVT0_12905 [Planctomycetaceae bacterium]